MFFSQRHKLKPLPEFQVNSMNDDLRVGLWNAFYSNFMSYFTLPITEYKLYKTQVDFLYNIWLYALKKPSDEFQRDTRKLIAGFKNYFLTAKWYEVFDLMEYGVGKYPDEETSKAFIVECNFILEKEFSAYRFVDAVVTPIVDEAQIRPEPEETAAPAKEAQPNMQPALRLYTHQAAAIRARLGIG